MFKPFTHGIRTLRRELDTVLVSLRLVLILSTSSILFFVSSKVGADPSRAAGVRG